ncbi:MAG: 1,4-alpha-glucan branching protein GlgB [Acutalibacteraceae bacterium]|nr:1,4-alpha-glucan branching protein GlgB [Acutalibacteraceae bacterium]
MDYIMDESQHLQAFSSGNSYNAYEYMGAHKVDDGSCYVFRVWAPNALAVSVVGSFNNWNETANHMSRIGNGDVWECYINGVNEYDVYRYCIESKNYERLYKSDPYGFHFETRPHNATIVYNVDSYQWNDGEWIAKRENINPKKSPMNIYEVHAGSWRRYADGNFYNYYELAEQLVPYVKEMGYTHIEFMPIMEYPYDGSWGYATTGYFAPTSRYGEPRDFMYFVDKCHQNGIGVILDWSISQFPKDEYALARFDGTCCYEYHDPLKANREDKGTLVFDYSRYEVISFLLSSAVFWADKYHIDGLRLDNVASMLYLDYNRAGKASAKNKFGGKENLEAVAFIQKMNLSIHRLFPSIITFAEESTAWPMISKPVTQGGLGFDFKWNMGWMNDMLHYMSLDPFYRPFNHANMTFSFFYAFAENFVLPISHDVVVYGKKSLFSKMPGDFNSRFDQVRVFMAYMMMHPGKKLTFMGAEIGQMEEWNTDSELSWSALEYPKNNQLQHFIKCLNKFYTENPPMYEIEDSWEGFHWIHHDDFTQCVLAFRRLDTQGNGIVVVCNFLPIKRENYNIGVPYKGIYEEVFNTDSSEFGGSGLTNGHNIETVDTPMHGYDQSLELTIPPLSVMYFKCKERMSEVNEINISPEDEETIEEVMELNEKIAELEEIENSDIEEKTDKIAVEEEKPVKTETKSVDSVEEKPQKIADNIVKASQNSSKKTACKDTEKEKIVEKSIDNSVNAVTKTDSVKKVPKRTKGSKNN